MIHKKPFIVYLFLFIVISVTAQIDRAVMPKLGPEPSLNLNTPHTFTLDNGLTVFVVENKKTPKISLSLSLDNPPTVEGDKAGVYLITSRIMGKGTKTMTKYEFNEKVDYLGAYLSISASGGYTQSLSRYKDTIIKLFADAALHPHFTQEELDLEKKRAIESVKNQEYNSGAIMERIQDVLVYGKTHPAGEYITEKTIANITLRDIKTYYKNHFVPSNAYMVISGDITTTEAKHLVTKHFGNWKTISRPMATFAEVVKAPKIGIHCVDMPAAVQTEISIANIAEITMASKDHHAALVANYILGGHFGSYINMNLREANGYTYGANSTFSRNKHYKSMFRVKTKVRNAVTDSAVIEILNEIKRIRTELVDDEVLKNAKAKFLGNFIMATENEKTMAARSINIKTQDLPEDFYKMFITKINAVTKEDIQHVAKTYFNVDTARIIVVGNRKEIVPNLQHIKFNTKKIPISYYDKLGNPIKPL